MHIIQMVQAHIRRPVVKTILMANLKLSSMILKHVFVVLVCYGYFPIISMHRLLKNNVVCRVNITWELIVRKKLEKRLEI